MQNGDAVNATDPPRDHSNNERLSAANHRVDCAKLCSTDGNNLTHCSKVSTGSSVNRDNENRIVRTSMTPAMPSDVMSLGSPPRKRVLCEGITDDDAIASGYGELRTTSISSTDSGSDLSRGSSDTGSVSFSSECSSNDNAMLNFDGALGNGLPPLHSSDQTTSRFLKSSAFSYPTANVEGCDRGEGCVSAIYQIKGQDNMIVDDYRVTGTSQTNFLITRGIAVDSSERCCVPVSTMNNCYPGFHQQQSIATIEYKDCNDENVAIDKCHSGGSNSDTLSRACHYAKSMLPYSAQGSTRGSSPKQVEPVSVKNERHMVCQQQCDTSYHMDQENTQLGLPRLPRDGPDHKSTLVKDRRDGDNCEQHGDCQCSMRSQGGLPLLTTLNQGSIDSSNVKNNSGFPTQSSPSHSTFDSVSSMSPTSDGNNESMRAIYPMMSMPNSLNERFLIQPHLSSGDEGKAAILTSRQSPLPSTGSPYPSVSPKTSIATRLPHGQELCGPSQFHGSNSCRHDGDQCSSHSAHIPPPNETASSKGSNSLICNSDGQLVVPAAFGELHGYKIQNTSNGNGLLLSVASAANNSTAQSSGTSSSIAKHSMQRQSSFALGSPSTPQDAARKRELRLQKNREAARECRRKKKEYIRCLENRVAVLESENKTLHDDLRHFRELYCQSAGAPGVHKAQHVHRLSPAVSTNLTSRPGSALPSSNCDPSTGTAGNHIFMNAHSANHQLPQLHHKILSGSDPRPCITACRKGPCTITMTEKRHQEI